MTETALVVLQDQIEAIRREAFGEGYAAAMKAVHELASRSISQAGGKVVVTNGNGSADEQVTHSQEDQTRQPDQTEQPAPSKAPVPLRTSNPVRRAPAKLPTARSAATPTRRAQRGRAKRGTNARMIQEILKKAAPRAVRQAEIRRALEQRGVSLAYPSIGHALGQLKVRKAAKQVGKSGTWRYSAAA